MAESTEENANILSVYKKDDSAIFDITGLHPIAQYEKVHFDAQLLSRISETIGNIAETTRLEQETQRTTQRQLQSLGRLIFNHIFPPHVQELLRNTTKEYLILRLDESFAEIPWELSYDGIDFLCNRFYIGRQVLSSRSLDIRNTAAELSRSSIIKILIVADPTGSLPAAHREAETLLELLDCRPDIDVELIGGERASRFHILQLLDKFDIIHFVGHSVFTSGHEQESGWQLHDGFLRPDDISHISRPPLLIFSNSCSSAAPPSVSNCERMPYGSSSTAQDTVQAGSLGLGGAFLLAGVSHYLGALWVLHDDSSAKFAHDFYTDLLQGATVGKALHNAKQKSANETAVQEFIWTAYVHYGNPGSRLFQLKETNNRERSDHAEMAARKPGRTSKRRYLFPSTVLALMVAVLLWYGYLQSFSLQGNPSRVPSQSLIMQLYKNGISEYRAGRIKAAMATFEHLINREDNQRGFGLAALAEIYQEAGLADQADPLLNRAFSNSQPVPMVYIVKGDRFWLAGDIRNAVNQYKTALQDQTIIPWQAARAYNSQGVIAFFAGNPEQARPLFQKALQFQQDNTDALVNLGVVARFLKQPKKASRYFQTAMEITDDQQTSVLLQSVNPETTVTATDKTSGKTLALGPFLVNHGTPKRIGLDHYLVQSIVNIGEVDLKYHIITAPELYGKEYSTIHMSSIAGQEKMTDLLQASGADIGIFGELGITENTLFLHLKIADLVSGRLLHNERFQSEGDKRFARLHQYIQSIIEKIFLKQDK